MVLSHFYKKALVGQIQQTSGDNSNRIIVIIDLVTNRVN